MGNGVHTSWRAYERVRSSGDALLLGLACVILNGAHAICHSPVRHEIRGGDAEVLVSCRLSLG